MSKKQTEAGDLTEAEAILEAGRMQAAATMTAALVARQPDRPEDPDHLQDFVMDTYDTLLLAPRRQY